jgi:Ion transport protein
MDPIMSSTTGNTTPSEVEGPSLDPPSAAAPPSPVLPHPPSLKQTSTIGNISVDSSAHKGVTWGQKSTSGKPSVGAMAAYTRASSRGKMSDESFRREKIRNETTNHVFLPWDLRYQTWWGFSVFMSIMTIFIETYQIAFTPAGLYPHNDGSAIIGYFFLFVFFIDILINFNLAFYDVQEELITDHWKIARRYLSLMFWIDLIGVFPFYYCALAISGQMGQDSKLARYLSLLGLLRMVRLHRVKQLFDVLQYSTRITLTTFTLTRNFGAALIWTHTGACGLYFIARQHDFADNTWIGPDVQDMSAFEVYVVSLYWSVVTFCTVGYVCGLMGERVVLLHLCHSLTFFKCAQIWRLLSRQCCRTTV